MFCSRCGARNDEDSKYCEKCGADLALMPRVPVPIGPPGPGTAPTVPQVAMPPTVYAPAQHHAWWYPIGVWVILGAFFAFIDLSTTHTITWSVWPIGILGIFMVGIPVLNLFEERVTRGPR